MHFCGDPFHDIPMLLSAFVADSPLLAQIFVWLRSKFVRQPCRADCEHSHERGVR